MMGITLKYINPSSTFSLDPYIFIYNFQEQVTWAILTRRSRYRTGTRYFVRGADDAGNVANFCETEQIIEKRSSGLAASYVQTRGSMPMKWTQTPDIYYKPKVSTSVKITG